jgi:hypothetical protein
MEEYDYFIVLNFTHTHYDMAPPLKRVHEEEYTCVYGYQ